MNGQRFVFSLLGPLEVRRGTQQIDVGPRKRRILLTRLLLSADRTVSVSQLCRDLWEGQQCPPGAVSSVHSHISRLRAALEPDRSRDKRSRLLVRESSGYVLAADAGDLDIREFEAALLGAQESKAAGDLLTASRALKRALGLWRGPALQEAAEYGFARQEAARLMEMRQLGEELLAGVLLEEGQVDAAIQLTQRLTKAAPLREESWEILLHALYRAGRSGEALHHYAQLRTILAEELGVDPGPALRELHLAILRHDQGALGSARPISPTLHRTWRDAPSGIVVTRPPRGTGRPGPTDDLCDGGHLPGRQAEFALLTELIDSAAREGTRWAVVSGESGAGKSSLLQGVASYAKAQGYQVRRLDCQRGRGNDSATVSEGVRPGCGNGAASVLLRRPDEQPLLFLADEPDATCSSCLALLRRLAAQVRDEPVAVVLSVKDPKHSALADLMADLAYLGAERLRLKPLHVTDIERILAAREPEGAMRSSADLRQEATALHQRSEGNPFLLRELLRLPPEQRSGRQARLPLSVETVLLPRVAQLPGQVRTLLEYAAAHGEVLDLPLLAATQSLGAPALLALVDEALAAGVLFWQSADGGTAGGETTGDETAGGEYRFRGPMRDVVLATLSPAARQARHTVIADALEGLPNPHLSALARHLARSGPCVSQERLGLAQLRAGREAQRLRRDRVARSWYRKAAATTRHRAPAVFREAMSALRRLDATGSGAPADHPPVQPIKPRDTRAVVLRLPHVVAQSRVG
ncbi:BTAD domain-containing putative transcriptional regulator [Streptomyces sp. NPDC020681]|uniref:BTAD domain-containing putative transcriptional regulator n=1 Tax=Streptomyces sp. NPDC020681 TaxID=3365083 RepID=UPI0037B0F92F